MVDEDPFDAAMGRAQRVIEEMRTVIAAWTPGGSTSVWARVFSGAMHDMHNAYREAKHGVTFVTYRWIDASQPGFATAEGSSVNDWQDPPEGPVEILGVDIIDAGAGDTEVLVRYMNREEL